MASPGGATSKRPDCLVFYWWRRLEVPCVLSSAVCCCAVEINQKIPSCHCRHCWPCHDWQHGAGVRSHVRILSRGRQNVGLPSTNWWVDIFPFTIWRYRLPKGILKILKWKNFCPLPPPPVRPNWKESGRRGGVSPGHRHVSRLQQRPGRPQLHHCGRAGSVDRCAVHQRPEETSWQCPDHQCAGRFWESADQQGTTFLPSILKIKTFNRTNSSWWPFLLCRLDSKDSLLHRRRPSSDHHWHSVEWITNSHTVNGH